MNEILKLWQQVLNLPTDEKRNKKLLDLLNLEDIKNQVKPLHK